MHVLYLHGFASGPLTEKGQRLAARLAGACASYGIPDLEAGDFTGLTMERIQERAVAAAQALPDDGQRLLVVGSSLGGYTAALLAAQGRLPRLAGLVLIAPAMGFVSSFTERLGPAEIAAWRAAGTKPFWHHGAQAEVPLGRGFLDSCVGLPDQPGAPGVPVALVHGRQDETVEHQASVAYALAHPGVELHLVEGDHRLTEPRHEDLIAWCARDLIARTAG